MSARAGEGRSAGGPEGSVPPSLTEGPCTREAAQVGAGQEEWKGRRGAGDRARTLLGRRCRRKAGGTQALSVDVSPISPLPAHKPRLSLEGTELSLSTSLPPASADTSPGLGGGRQGASHSQSQGTPPGLKTFRVCGPTRCPEERARPTAWGQR